MAKSGKNIDFSPGSVVEKLQNKKKVFREQLIVNRLYTQMCKSILMKSTFFSHSFKRVLLKTMVYFLKSLDKK